MPPVARPRGIQDILPASSGRWEDLLACHTHVASLFGYEHLELPIYEATELFERGTGAGTDVVEKEMFTFTDRGGRSLTLRPEGTPGAVRAVLEAHLDQEMRPVRVRYQGPMFRYDRPQAGRYHQFWQVGIEAIGEKLPALDAEVIEVAWRFFAHAGASGVGLQLNTLGDLDDRIRYRTALVDYYEPLRDELCDDCKRRLSINPLRLLDCKRDARFVRDAPTMDAFLSVESRRYFDQVLVALTNARIPFTINPRLVRGLDYYAHTTFEFWHESLDGAQNALGGGGRYDGLAEVLGFPSTPGVGYSLGVERTLMVLGDTALQATAQRAVVLNVGAEAAAYAESCARRLRDADVVTILDATDRRLDRKLRNADRVGAAVAVVVGETEMREGTASVRDVRSRTDEHVDVERLVEAVTGAMSGAAA